MKKIIKVCGLGLLFAFIYQFLRIFLYKYLSDPLFYLIPITSALLSCLIFYFLQKKYEFRLKEIVLSLLITVFILLINPIILFVNFNNLNYFKESHNENISSVQIKAYLNDNQNFCENNFPMNYCDEYFNNNNSFFAFDKSYALQQLTMPFIIFIVLPLILFLSILTFYLFYSVSKKNQHLPRFALIKLYSIQYLFLLIFVFSFFETFSYIFHLFFKADSDPYNYLSTPLFYDQEGYLVWLTFSSIALLLSVLLLHNIQDLIKTHPKVKRIIFIPFVVFSTLILFNQIVLVNVFPLDNLNIPNIILGIFFALIILTYYYYNFAIIFKFKFPNFIRKVAIALIASSTIFTVCGIFLVKGNPFDDYAYKLDQQRSNDLIGLEIGITNYYYNNKKLPTTLNDLIKVDTKTNISYASNFNDPKTGNQYGYQIVSDKNYKLCSDFSSIEPNYAYTQDDKGNTITLEHAGGFFRRTEIGNHCYEYNIDNSF